MITLQSPQKKASEKKGQWDIVIASLAKHQQQLKEILDSVERRDITPDQIKDYLQWVAQNLNQIRKKIPS